MSNKEKLVIIRQYLDCLISLAKKNILREKYELALESLSAYCNIQYQINQVYTDKQVENLVFQISKKLVHVSDSYTPNSRTVLFYDGFGADLRGLAASYIRALINNGYKLIYVTDKRCKGSIPHILSELKESNAEKYFIDMKSGQENWVKELSFIFEKHQPKSAFFYTTPHDVAAATVFDAYQGKVTRFQIDLTDHAFWVGVNAADYFLIGRIPGASNAIYERDISQDKIIRIDVCLYINQEKDSTPLPFDISKEKYIFSGGALYKTLGDKDLLFYRIISTILKSNKEIKFLYAGNGDDSELKKLMAIYPNRVYHICERNDFYELIKNCVFMLNTYPMFGGLMMRFAANAGRIPLTLKHGNDHEGLLQNQSALEIEYDTPEEVISEANRIISDDSYRRTKEKKLKGSVLTEEEFRRNIKLIIEKKKSEFEFSYVPHLDTKEFRETYLTRIDNPKIILARCIISKANFRLILLFPFFVMIRIFDKLARRWQN